MVKPRENRVPMMLSDEELEAIDTWRFANRIATRSDAIRRLVQIGQLCDELALDLNKRASDAYSSTSSFNRAFLELAIAQNLKISKNSELIKELINIQSATTELDLKSGYLAALTLALKSGETVEAGKKDAEDFTQELERNISEARENIAKIYDKR